MKITRDNYEAFLLDRLEGNLSEEVLNELEVFLLANPDIQMMDGAIPFVDGDAHEMPDKELLKGTIPPTGFHLNKLDDLLVAKLEGDLSPQQLQSLDELIGSDEKVARAWRIMQATKSIPAQVTFNDKRSLRKGGRIIAFRPILAIAASIALLFGVFWWTTPSVNPDMSTIADNKPTVEEGTAESIEEKTHEDYSSEPTNPDRIVEKETPVKQDVSKTAKKGIPARAEENPALPIKRIQGAKLLALRTYERGEIMRMPKSVPAPNMELIAYTEPADIDPIDDGSVTLSELLVGTFRKEVLDDKPTTEALNRGDALAMVNKGIKRVAGQESGIDLDDGSAKDGRRRYGLRLGDLSISASMSN